MILEILSVLLCLWLAARLGRRCETGDEGPTRWALAKRSLRWGVVFVTVPLLGFFGAVRFGHGAGIPSVFSLILCTGITALVVLGAEVELTGNVLLDCLLVSAGLVGACFTVVNGVPVALGVLSAASVCTWMLLCVGAAIAVRLFLWVFEES